MVTDKSGDRYMMRKKPRRKHRGVTPPNLYYRPPRPAARLANLRCPRCGAPAAAAYGAQTATVACEAGCPRFSVKLPRCIPEDHKGQVPGKDAP